jgi:hypothetical protein
MTQKLITHAERIEQILREFQQARDSDASLYATLLRSLGFDINTKTALDLLKGMHEGDVPHFESVRRTRQKLQEEHPDLRGQRYEERQKKRRDIKSEIIRRTEADRLAHTITQEEHR